MPIARDNVKTMERSVAEISTRCDSNRDRRTGERKTVRQDPLHRFISTPYAAHLCLMGRTVRLEASSRAVLDLARSFFRSHQAGAEGAPDFLWRIVCESDPRVESTAPPFCAFSDSGIQYVNIGQRGFMTVDLETREAAALFSDQFINEDETFWRRPLFDLLFCMTAPSLGLTTLSGGCVGIGGRGVLIFGPPNSGKTTACYLAARSGMEFHSDHVVFLDMKRNLLRAWGDLLPAFFRLESIGFLPELGRAARHWAYEEHEFYQLDKSSLQAQLARPVTPVCCLFLSRNATGEKQLVRITEAEALSRFRDCLLFDEDERFDTQISVALSALSSIPIYDFRYREDPGIAADAIKELLL
jgi:hypothetical protein